MTMYYTSISFLLFLIFLLGPIPSQSQQIVVAQRAIKVPVLRGQAKNPVLLFTINCAKPTKLEQIVVTIHADHNGKAWEKVQVYAVDKELMPRPSQLNTSSLVGEKSSSNEQHIRINSKRPLQKGANTFCITLDAASTLSLGTKLTIAIDSLIIDETPLAVPQQNYRHRMGLALRNHLQDNVHTYRIPGLVTSLDGTLLAIYDVRRDGSRDLQGDIDIGLSRSSDGGENWEPMRIIMDMGTWGGLPEKYNGVSDANILVDSKTGDIYVAGLWMHGLLSAEGKWIEGLSDSSALWNHQWKNNASQPGTNVKKTAQFLLVKSTDQGRTWTKPLNLTGRTKPKSWWLWAPAPGRGLSMKDGTLVFPTQGRDVKGKPFSNITYSKDQGRTWQVSAAASDQATTENMAVELNDGSLMLNMRANSNRGDTSSHNGRAVATTADLGKTWTVHPSSHHALPEPTCMASIIKHEYLENGQLKSILIFSNPDSKIDRTRLTLKVSFDEGKTWPKTHQILLDEERSRAYSCLSSINSDTIGILYESSRADLVFQQIALADLLQIEQ